MMDELWAGNSTEKITLLQTEPRIAPANVLVYDADDGLGTRQLRITRQPNSGLGGLIECEGVFYDPGVYGRHRVVDPAPRPRPTVLTYPVPDFGLFDLPALSPESQTAAQLQFAASNLDGLSYGGAFFESSNLGEATETSRAALGILLTNIDFEESECNAFLDSAIRIQLDSQSLVTVDEEDAVNGANLLAIKTSTGALLISVATAIPVSGQPRQWDLTRVWPGRFGTELFGTIAAGARCVLLTDANGEQRPGLQPISVPLARVSNAQAFEVSALLDPTKTSGAQSVTPQGRSLRPPTVANLTQVDDGVGGLNVRFMPRTRDWESAIAYWESGQEPRETDPRRFTLVLRNSGGVEVSRRSVSFASTAELPLQIHLTSGDLAGVASGEIWQEGTYLRGDSRSFEL
ncbi:hypothetical protein EON80_17595 [bacterium]|nr:MAG: hypothetical protein EON80_17595 [bacterium]